MACKIQEHNYDCNCDKDGIVKHIIIKDESIGGYNGLLAAIPTDDNMRDNFNNIIIQYGGVDKVCEHIPYVDLKLNRYGIYVPVDGNMDSKFTNLYHILYAKRRDEANETSGANPVPNQLRRTKTPTLTQTGGIPQQPQEQSVWQGPHSNISEPSVWGGQSNIQQPVQQFPPQFSSMEEYQLFLQWSQWQESIQQSQYQNVNIGNGVPINSQYNYQSNVQSSINRDGCEEYGHHYNGIQATDKELEALQKATRSFRGSSLVVKDNHEGEIPFSLKNVGNFKPESIMNTAPGWHPNDPRFYPDERPAQQPMMNMMTPNHVHPPSMMNTPGMVNENVEGKESFLSLNKLAQDRGFKPITNTRPTGEWRPNCLVVKTAEYPEGITENHPDYKRVVQQVKHETFGDKANDPNMWVMTPNNTVQNPTPPHIFDTDEDVPIRDLTDKEVSDILVAEQFGGKQKRQNYNWFGAPPSQPQIPMMQPNAQSSISVHNQNPWAAQPQHFQQHMMGPQFFGNSMVASPYALYNSNNEWMLPTASELRSGRVPVCKLVKADERPPEAELPKKKKRTFEDIQVAFVYNCVDENGVEYQEYISGDRDIVKEKPDPKSMHYKEAAQLAKAVDSERETYALAEELSRYNETMADDLLWYHNSGDIREYQEFRKEAQSALIKYRSEDPLSAIKSTVFIAGDKAIIKPGKPTTMGELERIAMSELLNYKRENKTQEEKEKEVLDTYRANQCPATIQRKAILESDSLVDIIKRLQAFKNMRVICSDETDKIKAMMDERLQQLPKYKADEREQYHLWKTLTRGSMSYLGKDLTGFEENFDKWWFKPRRNPEDQQEKSRIEYRDKMNELKEQQLHRLVPVDKEKAIADYNAQILKSYRDYDHGCVRPDMSMCDWMNGMNYLLTRNVELKIEKESNKTTRLFNPHDYLEEVRRHSAIRNMQDGKGFFPTMDLMDKKVYAKKRQAFIDQIFKKANRGTLM